jgi:transglutaminase-like putative cysteine protease
VSLEGNPKYIESTEFIESEKPEISALAEEIVRGGNSDREKIQLLFYFVRDKISYKPCFFNFMPKEEFKATVTLKRGYGLCIMKAILLISFLRSLKIPSRFVLSEIRHHQLPFQIKEELEGDVLIHGFTEAFIGEKWIKLNPTFDLNYCNKMGYVPTEFDGEKDALFHPMDREGRRLIEYLNVVGHFSNFPYDFMLDCIRKKYGTLGRTFLTEVNKGEAFYKGWT